MPVSLACSSAAVTKALATTARRRSSAAGPSSLTNAATSQEDMSKRADPTRTVVMERPREGGAEINCSQTFSMQVSKSRPASISTGGVVVVLAFVGFADGAEFGALETAGAAGAEAEGNAALSKGLPKTRSTFFSTSARKRREASQRPDLQCVRCIPFETAASIRRQSDESC